MVVRWWFIVATDLEGKRGSRKVDQRRGSRTRSVSIVPVRHLVVSLLVEKCTSERENLLERDGATTRILGRERRSSKLSHVRVLQCDVAGSC